MHHHLCVSIWAWTHGLTLARAAPLLLIKECSTMRENMTWVWLVLTYNILKLGHLFAAWYSLGACKLLRISQYLHHFGQKSFLLHDQWKFIFPTVLFVWRYSKATLRSCDQKESNFSIDNNYHLITRSYQFWYTTWKALMYRSRGVDYIDTRIKRAIQRMICDDEFPRTWQQYFGLHRP